MSYVEIYKVQDDGDVVPYGEARNSHGFAPLIWGYLGRKHIEPNYNQFLDIGLEKLFSLFISGKLSRREDALLGATADKVWIRKDFIPDLIVYLREFYLYHCKDKVETMIWIADSLQKMLEDSDMIGCAFNCTSVCESFWDVYDGLNDEWVHYNINNEGNHWELSEDLHK